MRILFEQINRVKTLVSDFLSPHLVGAGIGIEGVSDNDVCIDLPWIWTNMNRSRTQLSPGVVISAAEMAVQLLLDRHIHQLPQNSQFREWKWKSHVPLTQGLKLKFAWRPSERESILNELYRTGAAKLEGEVLGFFNDDRLACTIEFTLSLNATLSLPAGDDQEVENADH